MLRKFFFLFICYLIGCWLSPPRSSSVASHTLGVRGSLPHPQILAKQSVYELFKAAKVRKNGKQKKKFNPVKPAFLHRLL
jgi:hypothetical protein